MEIGPNWKLTKIKAYQNNTCVVEFAVQVDPTDDLRCDFCVIGTFFITDEIFNSLLESKLIRRTIIIEDTTVWEND